MKKVLKAFASVLLLVLVFTLPNMVSSIQSRIHQKEQKKIVTEVKKTHKDLFETKYGYQSLSKEGKRVYSLMYYGIFNRKKEIEIEQVTTKRMEDILKQMESDCPGSTLPEISNGRHRERRKTSCSCPIIFLQKSRPNSTIRN